MSQERTDEELLAAFQQGDVGAFEALLRRHRAPLFTFLVRMLGEREKAEDLAQETFLRIVKGAQAWEHRARFQTWLYTIARNLCVDQSRRDRVRRPDSLHQTGPHDQPAMIDPAPAGDPSPGPAAGRAAEAERHVAGCPDCRRERGQMAAPRRAAAPLRELEEPSASFDARILAAARAEASLQSEGKPGPVIEVTGTVRPLGLEPARIDAHAKVSSAPDRRRRRWAMRVALGGSAAAAAALALVVSTTLQKPAKHNDDAEKYAIRVPTAA